MNQIFSSFLAVLTCVFLSVGEAVANDAIITEFGSKTAQAMCADGGAWLEAYQIPRDRCPEISISVLTPCMTRVLEGREVPLKSEEELRQVSQNLYGCMKDSFLAQYGGTSK